MLQMEENHIYACPNCEYPLDVSRSEEQNIMNLCCTNEICGKPGIFKMLDKYYIPEPVDIHALILVAVSENRTYKILLCADSLINPPSPWTDDFRIEIDHENKVIRFIGDFT